MHGICHAQNYPYVYLSFSDLSLFMPKTDPKQKEGSTSNLAWSSQTYLKCSWSMISGIKEYVPKAERKPKLLKKAAWNCHAKLIMKRYPDIDQILDQFEKEYDHPLNVEHLWMLRLSYACKNQIANLMQQRVLNPSVVSSGILILWHCRCHPPGCSNWSAPSSSQLAWSTER